MDNTSDDENSTARVQSTPVDLNSYRKDKFFSQYDDFDTSPSGTGPYCLVGEDVPTRKSKKSVKQRRTTNRNSNPVNIQDEVGGTYCEITDVSNDDSVYQIPPSNKQSAAPETEDLYQVPPNLTAAPDTEDLYQVPPSTHRPISGSGFQYPSSHNQSVETIEEDYYGVPSSYPKQPDSKAINVPKPKVRSHTMPVQRGHSMDTYNNVNLQSQLSTDSYDNVQLKSSPVGGENYDNVNIRNKGSPSNESYYQQPPSSSIHSGGSSEGIFYQGSPTDSYYQQPPSSSVGSNPGDDMYYQAPPSTFKTKPDRGIKQTSNQPQQYTVMKTKSMKQKRTATIVKKDIDLSDSPPTHSGSPPLAIPVLSSIDKQDSVDSSDDQERKIQEAKENLLAQADVEQGSPKPIPKPRMKQSRTSERRVESGYRMSQIATKQPMDETYEWSKVRWSF